MTSCETQHSIAVWGHSVFGASTPIELGILAAAEMDELLAALESDPQCKRESTQSEAADVAVFLMRLAAVSGFNLLAAVDRKMAVNRKRKWVKQADGTWLKVKEAAK